MLPASLDPVQFAYHSNHSTDDAIAFTLHTALSHLENKNTYVRMLFVDYSSAFNTIVPATLVAKLQTLGLNRSLCSCILDFLTGRSQVVRMGNNTSSPLVLNTGAPHKPHKEGNGGIFCNVYVYFCCNYYYYSFFFLLIEMPINKVKHCNAANAVFYIFNYYMLFKKQL